MYVNMNSPTWGIYILKRKFRHEDKMCIKSIQMSKVLLRIQDWRSTLNICLSNATWRKALRGTINNQGRCQNKITLSDHVLQALIPSLSPTFAGIDKKTNVWIVFIFNGILCVIKKLYFPPPPRTCPKQCMLFLSLMLLSQIHIVGGGNTLLRSKFSSSFF